MMAHVIAGVVAPFAQFSVGMTMFAVGEVNWPAALNVSAVGPLLVVVGGVVAPVRSAVGAVMLTLHPLALVLVNSRVNTCGAPFESYTCTDCVYCGVVGSTGAVASRLIWVVIVLVAFGACSTPGGTT